jgi:hypothetical protein
MAKPNPTTEQPPATVAQPAPTTSRSRGPAVNRVTLMWN